MKCFTHPGADAVAVCRHCGRALCHDCSAEVDGSVACKGNCAARVMLYDDLLTKSHQAYQNAESSAVGDAIYWFVIGGLFILFGVRSDHGDAFWFLGLVLLVTGIRSYIGYREQRKQSKV